MGETIKLLKTLIGKKLKCFQTWDMEGDGTRTFDTLGLVFEEQNIKLSCNCENYDATNDEQGEYADISVFKAYDCGKNMISAPLWDTEPINVSIDEELIEIKLIHEDAILHCSHSGDEYQWLHTRAIVFMFQTKSLSIWKDMSWSEIINVSVSDKNWQLPPNEEWENSEDEIYDVTSSIEILN